MGEGLGARVRGVGLRVEGCGFTLVCGRRQREGGRGKRKEEGKKREDGRGGKRELGESSWARVRFRAAGLPLCVWQRCGAGGDAVRPRTRAPRTGKMQPKLVIETKLNQAKIDQTKLNGRERGAPTNKSPPRRATSPPADVLFPCRVWSGLVFYSLPFFSFLF